MVEAVVLGGLVGLSNSRRDMVMVVGGWVQVRLWGGHKVLGLGRGARDWGLGFLAGPHNFKVFYV